MTVLSRGARNRRGGRRPGWFLLTALLFLAIVASSALVFTNRVDLLKLAVILSLWAAIIGAFVSVVYRRQSDTDQARVRDLKLVYDLQLDREISARREYELGLETHLRREIGSEIRAQASDEVAALRSELAALRANLEVLFDADLSARPALEGERSRRPYPDWTEDTTTIPAVPGRVESSRITPVSSDVPDVVHAGVESPIIDVPEEPLVASPPPDATKPRRRRRTDSAKPDVQPPAEAPSWSPVPEPPSATPAWTPIGAEAAFLPPPYAQPQSAPKTPPRHSSAGDAVAPAAEAPIAPEPPETPNGQHSDGQSVAELMARLQSGSQRGGGRRRARED